MGEKIDGEYPNGFLNADDEGSVQLAISEEHGNVRIDFSDTVKWFALPPDQAALLGMALIKQARKIGLKVPFVMEL